MASVVAAILLAWAATVVAVLPLGAGSREAAALILAAVLVAAVAGTVSRFAGVWFPAGVVVGTIVFVAVASGADAVHPLFGPLGYSNATAAWYAAGVGAAAVAAVDDSHVALRLLFAVAALGLAALPVMIGADGATAAVAVTLLVAVVAAAGRWLQRAVVVVSGLGTLAIVAGTTMVGLASVDGVSDEVAATVGEARPRLWGEAISLIERRPASGLGEGAFGRLAPSGADRDTAWAHHELLELALEHGILAALLVVIAIVVIFVALWSSGGRVAAVAAASLATAVALASIDYVWHQSAVVLSLAAIAGMGVGRTSTVPTTERRDGG